MHLSTHKIYDFFNLILTMQIKPVNSWAKPSEVIAGFHKDITEVPFQRCS